MVLFRDLSEHESSPMTACNSLVGPFPRRWFLALVPAFLATAMLANYGQAQTRSAPPKHVPPTQASPYRARLAAWQNEAPGPAPGEQPPAFEQVPGAETMPLERGQPETAPPEVKQPARSTQPQSRLRSAPAQMQQRQSPAQGQPLQSDYATESLDQWIQSDVGYGACGPSCGPTCGPACGPRCCGPGGCLNCPPDPCFQCRPNLWWLQADLLLGFRKGRGYPPLVTTDPSTEDSTTAGVLPNATILYDGDSKNTQMQPGLNLDFGTWLNDCQNVGFGGRFFFFGNDDGNFSTNSGFNSVLAIPFFSVDLGAPSSLLLAHPDVAGEVRSGSVDIRASNEIHGFDAYLRFLYCRTACGRVDFITGYHTSSVNDDFQLRMQTDGNQVNNDVRLLDRFDTRNHFHGLILGILAEHQVCCMTLKGKARVSVGNMRQTVNISGGTTVNGVLDQNEPGGLFTSASNIGKYEQDQFAAVTEAGLALGYFITPRTQVTVGYNLMYWSSVVRPGEQIDTVIDDRNVPPTRPTFDFRTSSFWVQSVTLGLNCEF